MPAVYFVCASSYVKRKISRSCNDKQLSSQKIAEHFVCRGIVKSSELGESCNERTASYTLLNKQALDKSTTWAGVMTI